MYKDKQIVTIEFASIATSILASLWCISLFCYQLRFEDKNEIVGLILPDGDSFNSCIKNGYESIFSQMIDLSEKELTEKTI